MPHRGLGRRFSRKNINALDRLNPSNAFMPVMERAGADGVKGAGYTSTVLGCPYGETTFEMGDVVRVAQRLYELGCYEVSLGDTHPAWARRRKCGDAGGGRRGAATGPGGAFPRYGARPGQSLPVSELSVAVVDAAGRHRRLSLRGASGNVATERGLHARWHGHRHGRGPCRAGGHGALAG